MSEAKKKQNMLNLARPRRMEHQCRLLTKTIASEDALQEPQVERGEQQNDADVHHQSFPEPVSDEKHVETHDDGHHECGVGSGSDVDAHSELIILAHRELTSAMSRLPCVRGYNRREDSRERLVTAT